MSEYFVEKNQSPHSPVQGVFTALAERAKTVQVDPLMANRIAGLPSQAMNTAVWLEQCASLPDGTIDAAAAERLPNVVASRLALAHEQVGQHVEVLEGLKSPKGRVIAAALRLAGITDVALQVQSEEAEAAGGIQATLDTCFDGVLIETLYGPQTTPDSIH